MAFRETMQARDVAIMGLSESPENQEFLPLRMRCPVGHEAERHFHYSDRGDPPIPFYACYPCTVVYRYQECNQYD